MKTLLISGKLQSGKTSLARYLHGYILKERGALSVFEIKEDGRLYVNARDNIHGDFMGELDIERRDYTYIDWASQNIWPHIKMYNFAERLKQSLHFIFGVEWDTMYVNKDNKTKIKWSDFSSFLPPRTISKAKKDNYYDNFMTGREILQQFGEACRRVDANCWVDRCIENIQQENPEFSLIADVRYPNEIVRVKELNKDAKVIRLKRQINNDTHSSEIALDEWSDDKFDLVIDNNKMTITEKNQAVTSALQDWKWI